MPSQAIKILIADSEGTTCDRICSFLTGDPTYQVVGRAVNADECMSLALIKRPDVILVHNGLKPTSGIEVCEQLTLQNLDAATLLVVAQAMDENLFRRMMAANVSELLVAPAPKKTGRWTPSGTRSTRKPASATAARPASSEESRRIIAVTGARGGCGRTMVAVNLSCAIARAMERVQSRRQTTLSWPMLTSVPATPPLFWTFDPSVHWPISPSAPAAWIAR